MSKLGYIVHNETIGFVGKLLQRDNELWRHVPDAGILLNDSNRSGSVFRDRGQARAAIARTIRYFQIHGTDNERVRRRRQDDEYAIVALHLTSDL